MEVFFTSRGESDLYRLPADGDANDGSNTYSETDTVQIDRVLLTGGAAILYRPLP